MVGGNYQAEKPYSSKYRHAFTTSWSNSSSCIHVLEGERPPEFPHVLANLIKETLLTMSVTKRTTIPSLVA